MNMSEIPIIGEMLSKVKKKEQFSSKKMPVDQIWCKEYLLFKREQLMSSDWWRGSEYAKNSKVQREHAEYFFDFSKLNGNEVILDLGCGPGEFAALLSNKVPKGKMVGIDPSASMLDYAIHHYPSKQYPNLEFSQQQAQNFSWKESFDLVVSVYALHWVKEQDDTFKNIYRHLKVGGRLFFIVSSGKEGLAFGRALNKTVADWQYELRGFQSNQYFNDIEAERQLLVNAGFHVDKLIYQYMETSHLSVDELGRWIAQWLPQYNFLDEKVRDQFLQELMHHYVEEEGTVAEDGTIKWGVYVIVGYATKQGLQD